MRQPITFPINVAGCDSVLCHSLNGRKLYAIRPVLSVTTTYCQLLEHAAPRPTTPHKMTFLSLRSVAGHYVVHHGQFASDLSLIFQVRPVYGAGVTS